MTQQNTQVSMRGSPLGAAIRESLLRLGLEQRPECREGAHLAKIWGHCSPEGGIFMMPKAQTRSGLSTTRYSKKAMAKADWAPDMRTGQAAPGLQERSLD